MVNSGYKNQVRTPYFASDNEKNRQQGPLLNTASQTSTQILEKKCQKTVSGLSCSCQYYVRNVQEKMGLEVQSKWAGIDPQMQSQGTLHVFTPLIQV